MNEALTALNSGRTDEQIGRESRRGTPTYSPWTIAGTAVQTAASERMCSDGGFKPEMMSTASKDFELAMMVLANVDSGKHDL
ncbi:hypothetical protein PIB30_054720 [Stylosanthes scabra]|uniref:Uncharacterized protein n=1 Tax=Stylosanthes scabra TaxID=79078 RepID=A0ABU6ZHL4_9FABA|nr:hypothetical protein [Stylosanthes scabra]